MESQDFRELNLDLPRQPLANQLPWLIAGIVLMLAILTIAACAYLEYKKNVSIKDQQPVSFKPHNQQTTALKSI